MKKIVPVALEGLINAPPSKSMAHRLLLATVPVKGECVIDGVDLSDDILATLDGIRALGKKTIIQKTDTGSNRIRVDCESLLSGIPVIDCKESGSTLRFFIPMALAIAGGGVFLGRGRLGERPLMPYQDQLVGKGVIWQADSQGLPLTVKGSLPSGEYCLPGDVSSQFITGFLMALPLVNGDSSLEIEGTLESAPYVDITLEVLRKYGVTVIETVKHKRYLIPGNQTFRKTHATVEGDWSQAAFFMTAGVFGHKITIQGLDISSMQGDKMMLSFLRAMGGKIKYQNNEMVICRSALHGIDADISQCPDIAPTLVLACALAKGKSKITGGKRLRAKESDRIASIGKTLNALGAKVEITADGFNVEGSDLLQGGNVSSFGDHRIAMMVAVAAGKCRAPVFLEGSEAVNKSYPGFWEDYRRLGGVWE